MTFRPFQFQAQLLQKTNIQTRKSLTGFNLYLYIRQYIRKFSFKSQCQKRQPVQEMFLYSYMSTLGIDLLIFTVLDIFYCHRCIYQ